MVTVIIKTKNKTEKLEHKIKTRQLKKKQKKNWPRVKVSDNSDKKKTYLIKIIKKNRKKTK